MYCRVLLALSEKRRGPLANADTLKEENLFIIVAGSKVRKEQVPKIC